MLVRENSGLIKYNTYSTGNPRVGRGTVRAHLGKEGKRTTLILSAHIIFAPRHFTKNS